MPKTRLEEFKQAFKEVLARNDESEKGKTLEEGMRDVLDDLQGMHDTVKAKLTVVKKAFADKVEAKAKQIVEQTGEVTEEAIAKEQKRIRDELKIQLDEANKCFIEASNAADYHQADELLDELSAMVDDYFAGNHDRLTELLSRRELANKAIDEEIGKATTDPHKLESTRGKERAPGVEEDDPAQRSLDDVLKGRAKAQKWREREIEAVEKAHEALVELDAEFEYSKIVTTWLEDLKQTHATLHKAVTDACEEFDQAQADVKQAAKDIRQAEKDIAYCERKGQEAAESNDDKKVEQFRAGKLESEQELRDAQQKQLNANGEIDRLRNEIPIKVMAVNDAVDNAEAALAHAIDTLRNEVHKNHPTLEVVVPPISTDKFRMADLDLSGTEAEVPDMPNVDEISIDPQRAFPDLERIAGKHGTGRHGAQTGMEQQARRLATGGSTPDQPGNEWGTTRQVVDDEGQPLKLVTWKKVDIQWTESGEGREISGRVVEAITRAVQEEVRQQGASAASMFLNPEVEFEAVERAKQLVIDNLPWTQVQDEKGEWQPLTRVAVTISKPRKTNAIGYGHGMVKGDAEKLSLEQANAVLDEFRTGKINQNEMLKRLDSSLVQRESGGGAKIMPQATVVLDRVGGAWSNTTQFPCAETQTLGWDLAGKQVREGDQAVAVEAPQLVGS